MKRLTFILLFTSISLFSFGQDTSDVVDPIGQVQIEDGEHLFKISPSAIILGQFKGNYEYVFSNKYTFGSNFNLHNGYSYKGFRLEPFARYYITGNAPSGFYMQPKLNIGYAGIKGDKKGIWEMGGSATAGYQMLFGAHKNIALDLYGGIRFSNLDKYSIADNLADDQTPTEHNTKMIGYKTIYANRLEFGASIGYRF